MLKSNNIVYYIQKYETFSDFGFIENKIKNFIFKSNFGKCPEKYLINNGKDILILNSINNLYTFINKA